MKMAESSSNGYKTLGKGEIARFKQFLLFPKCFQKDLYYRSACKNQGFFGKELNHYSLHLYSEIVYEQ